MVGGGVYFAQSSSAANPAAEPAATGSTVSAAATDSKDRIKFGKKYQGVATSYAADGSGACNFKPGGSMMIAALNAPDYQGALMCGAYVKVTGPGGKSIRVKIVDRCPSGTGTSGCRVNQLDLSRQAMNKLAPGQGKINVTWRLVSPKLKGPVQYVYEKGSTKWWCGVQVRNHRNPIRTVEFKTAGGWHKVARRDYNFFESKNGKGCGNTIRITDVKGNRLVDKGIKISTKVQKGKKQLPAV
nr:expansin EXLX1 family cellulose-binding protein [Kineosporia babensis]